MKYDAKPQTATSLCVYAYNEWRWKIYSQFLSSLPFYEQRNFETQKEKVHLWHAHSANTGLYWETAWSSVIVNVE